MCPVYCRPGGTKSIFSRRKSNKCCWWLYSNIYFDLEAKDKADEMVENVRDEFKKILYELTWMDSSTRANAHMKVD